MGLSSNADGPLCIIPARGGSKRFPRKNAAQFEGRPLVGQAVRVALESGVFAAICVSSDDDEILSIGRECGADLCLARGLDLASYDLQVKDVCRSVLLQLAAEGRHFPSFAVVLPTSPLRIAADLEGAYRTLIASGADCCMSLVACEHPPQRSVCLSNGRVELYFGPQYSKATQALETLYRHDGTVLMARTEPFLREQTFYGLRVVPFIVPRERAVDIDSPIDLAWAEFISARERQK